MQYVQLNNGVEIPVMGYGVFQIADALECARCVSDALEVGCRSIDTAASYMNETAVGDAIRASALPRESLFITSKNGYPVNTNEVGGARVCRLSKKRLKLFRKFGCRLPTHD